MKEGDEIILKNGKQVIVFYLDGGYLAVKDSTNSKPYKISYQDIYQYKN